MTTAPGVEFRLTIEAEAGDPSNQYLYFIIYLFLFYMFVWKVLTLKWSGVHETLKRFFAYVATIDLNLLTPELLSKPSGLL